LIGEFSGLHGSLKSGLQELGHEATIFASGDGFKQFNFDRYWGQDKVGYFDLTKFLAFQQPKLLYEISETYDVVQIVNPSALISPNHGRSVYYKVLAQIFKRSRGVKSMVVAGCDHAVERKMSVRLPQLCKGCLEDQGTAECQFRSADWAAVSKTAAEMCDVIIPFSSSVYADSYSDYGDKNVPPIMFPVDTRSLPVVENRLSGRIKILHGINRPGFKGSDLILRAMNRAQEKYPDRFDLIVTERLPFSKYIQRVSDVNVVIDQAHADGFGMNALFSLAMERVVMTSYFPGTVMGDLDYKTTPAINIFGDEEVIFDALIRLLDWSPEDFSVCGKQSRQFVEEKCAPTVIAGQLIGHWGAVLNNG